MKKGLVVIGVGMLLLPFIVVAGPTPGSTAGGTPGSTAGGTPGFDITIPNPLNVGNSIYEFLFAIIDRVIIPVGAVVAVIFIIYSGFLFVTAQGSEEKLRAAKSAFLYAVIGSAILLGSWVIAQAIENTVNQLRAAQITPAAGGGLALMESGPVLPVI